MTFLLDMKIENPVNVENKIIIQLDKHFGKGIGKKFINNIYKFNSFPDFALYHILDELSYKKTTYNINPGF